MSKKNKALLMLGFIVFAVLVLTTTYLYHQNNSQKITITQLETQNNSNQEKIISLTEDIKGLEAQLKTADDILSARKPFMSELDLAKQAIKVATGKVDVTTQVANIKVAANNVLEEKTNPHTIIPQTEAVRKATGEILSLVKAKEEEKLKAHQAVIDREAKEAQVIPEEIIGEKELKNLKTLTKESGARQALDAVGGTDIKLGSADMVCDWEKALACAYATGVVLVRSEYADESYDWWYDYMMHEYAHHVQFEYTYAMWKSDGYKTLFDSDIEHLADCMAAAKIADYISPYGNKCTQQQKDFGRDAWQGKL